MVRYIHRFVEKSVRELRKNPDMGNNKSGANKKKKAKSHIKGEQGKDRAAAKREAAPAKS